MNEVEEIKAGHRAMQRRSVMASRISTALGAGISVFVILRWRDPLGPVAHTVLFCMLSLNIVVIGLEQLTRDRWRANLLRRLRDISPQTAASFEKIEALSTRNNRALFRSNVLVASSLVLFGAAVFSVRGHPTTRVILWAIIDSLLALGAVVWSLIEARRVLARLRRAGPLEEQPDYVRAIVRFRDAAERILRLHADDRRRRGEDPKCGFEQLAMFDAWREVMTWCLVAASERGFDPGQAIELLLKVTHVACDEALALIARTAIDEHMKKHHPEENPPSADHLN